MSSDTGIDNVFFLEKSCRKMYTIFSAVQRQERKSDVMTSFGLTACSAVYYQVPHCRFLIAVVFIQQELSTAFSLTSDVASQIRLYLWFGWTDFDEIDHFSFKKISYHIHNETITDKGAEVWLCIFLWDTLIYF
jgi:hypothetical protein